MPLLQQQYWHLAGRLEGRLPNYDEKTGQKAFIQLSVILIIMRNFVQLH